MAYQDFSIESAITPNYSRPSVKLQGVANAVRIMKDPSRASEDFIQGAVTSIGAANRHVLYVNSSLEALNDRLRIASKIAYAVNTSKRRGAEGFSDVPMMNPWAYALEGNGKDFFKRVWQAICTACRRVIDAIANFIRWLGTVIAGLDTKKQIEHYKLYVDNKSKITQDVDNKVGKKKIKSPAWKVNKDGIESLITKFLGFYVSNINAVLGSEDAKIIEKLSRKTLKDREELTKFAEEAFGQGADYIQKAKDITQAVTTDLNKNLSSVFTGISVDTRERLSAKEIVMKTFAKGDKTVELPISEIKKISGDFTCLHEGKLAKAAKDMVSTLHKHQKNFTIYTKNIDKIAKAFDRFVANEDDAGYKNQLDSADTKEDKSKIKKDRKATVNSMSNALSAMANARIRSNSYITAVALETQMCILRFNKTAHIALKAYLAEVKVLKGKEDKQTAKDAKKGVGLAGAASTTESLFRF